jgi:hypothetical protein
MINPIFAFSAYDIWIAQLKNDVAEILRKRLSCKPFHVFENKYTRLNFTHYSSCLREKVPAVTHRTVFTTDGKWLARWATGDQVGPASPGAKILMMNVPLDEGPMPNSFISTPLVGTDCLTRIMIVLEHGIMLEPRVRSGESKTASASEKLHAPQRTARVRSLIFAHHARIVAALNMPCLFRPAHRRIALQGLSTVERRWLSGSTFL